MRTFRKTNKITAHSGFSLIELMVSLTVFSIVMVTSIGTLLTLVDANAKAQALYTGMTNLSFAVDSMSRNIRTAYDHYCVSGLGGGALPSGNADCNGGDAVVFTREKDAQRVGYRLSGNSIEQKIANGSWLPITSSSTKITAFEVSVLDSDGGPGDTNQTQVSLLIKGYVNNGLETATNFSLQTNVTQKILNY